MGRRDWSREELILAMNLYCQLPFGRLHKGTPEIIALARAIDRTPSSVAMKLCNLASLDPAHQKRGVKGLSGASASDRKIWNEFHADWDGLVMESEQLRTRFHLHPESPDSIDDIGDAFTGDTETKRTVIVRLAQRFFRRAVLASFDTKCCITGIRQSELLIASHIVPWKQSREHRANPRNGLCLSRIHDGAFDRGLITLDKNHRLVVSKELARHFDNRVLKACFLDFEGNPVSQPNRFLPDQNLLEIHRQTVFRG